MKKIAVMMVLVLGAAFAAQAEVLMYFTANAFDWSGPKLFDFAMVGVAKDGETNWGGASGDEQVYLSIRPDGGTTESIFLASDDERYRATGWANLTDYTDYSGYTFYIETYANDSDEPIWAYSADTAKTYAQLVQDNHIYDTTSTDSQDLQTWNVPEPTSGLLSLFGLAMLALKRKRVSTGRSLVIPYRTW